jgi:hypothetical protein
MINFDTIKAIECLWADDGSSYRYEASPKSINANAQTKSLQFTMREIDGQDSELEIVIQQKADGSLTFKTDYYDDPLHEYLLKDFSSTGEQILYFRGKEGIAYFHIKE